MQHVILFYDIYVDILPIIYQLIKSRIGILTATLNILLSQDKFITYIMYVVPILFTIPIYLFCLYRKTFFKYAHKSKYVYKKVLKKLIDVINNIV